MFSKSFAADLCKCTDMCTMYQRRRLWDTETTTTTTTTTYFVQFRVNMEGNKIYGNSVLTPWNTVIKTWHIYVTPDNPFSTYRRFLKQHILLEITDISWSKWLFLEIADASWSLFRRWPLKTLWQNEQFLFLPKCFQLYSIIILSFIKSLIFLTGCF